MLHPKSNIEKLMPASHGGIDYHEIEGLGIAPEAVIDFSVSTNPFGPPPGTREAMCQASIEQYPDTEATELVNTLAAKLNIAQASFILGNGSTELIRMAATAYFGAGDLVIIPQPTYSDYEVACQLVNAQVLKQPVLDETNLQLNATEVSNLIRANKPRGVFLCNPNNPTGQYLSREEMKEILTAARDTLLVLDEAYIAFTEGAWPSLDLINSGNLVVLRSMTKDYALAGVRLGYAIAAEPIISVLKKVRPPWNVSSAAQAAGVHALKAEGYIEECGAKIREAKKLLVDGLEVLGLSPLPTKANFFLVKVKDPVRLRQALLKKGFLVRDCASFGLPHFVRVAPRKPAECQRLLSALKEPGVFRHAR